MMEPVLKDRRDARREAILEVAGAIFAEEGYEAASMSAIAARLGGSKGTLYNYFKSKEELFTAYIQAECGRISDALFGMLDSDADFTSRLRAVGEHLLTHLLSERALRTFQLVVSESRRHPELAAVFYECGPQVGLTRLTEHLEIARARGEIIAEDCGLAAEQLIVLCRGHLHFRRALNLIDPPSAEEISATVDEALNTFLARYGKPNT